MKFKTLQQITFFSLLTAISLGFLWIIKDYIMPIFWAIVFAIIFAPLHRKYVSGLKNKSLASVATISTILLIIFLPLFIIGSLVVSESLDIYQQLSQTSSNGEMTISIFEKVERVLPYLEKVGIDETQIKENIITYASTATNWIATQVIALGSGAFIITIKFFLMLYVLFFLIRDGEHIQQRIIDILPLGNKREKRLLKKFTLTTRAVVKGTLVIGVLQGFIGGVIFSIAGINSAILWGLLMTILSVIPALGTALVWLPAGIILLATGSVWQGAFVLIGGGLIISLIDNIVRPILIGKDTKMPDVFILISTLGGLSIFGITGFVIGPIVAGFFIVMWEIFEEEHKTELELYG